MNNHYADIRDRIPEPPKWWDEHAVPRYCAFAPGRQADSYADRVALVEIACQNCGERFLVAMSESVARSIFTDGYDLCLDITAGTLHYGDPPNIGCCPSGPSMNCNDLQVVEFWRREAGEWSRDPQYEVMLPDHSDYKEPKP